MELTGTLPAFETVVEVINTGTPIGPDVRQSPTG
jgi:hypothetical protein